GQGGDDLIEGNGGDDTLIGGLGNDKLKGGLGADTYIFSKGHGQDRIYEDASSIAEEDIIRFVDIYTPEILWFSRKGEHLMISNLDTSDSVVVNNWYRHRDYQIERIELANGQSINQQQLDKLVSSMAAFETQYVNDASELPREAMKEYISMLAVNNYYV
ncbi:hypothetical protein O7M46_07680, partial [Bisgaard Taxon 45]|nr:hypothetical protein [Bisgaard Taxon 45]